MKFKIIKSFTFSGQTFKDGEFIDEESLSKFSASAIEFMRSKGNIAPVREKPVNVEPVKEVKQVVGINEFTEESVVCEQENVADLVVEAVEEDNKNNDVVNFIDTEDVVEIVDDSPFETENQEIVKSKKNKKK